MKADIAHELLARSPRVAPEHLQFSFVGSETENRIQRGRFARAVRADESEDTTLFDPQIDAVERDSCAEGFAKSACFYRCHDFSASFQFSASNRGLWQRPVLSVSDRAAECSRKPEAILPRETFRVRLGARDRARRL